MQQNEKKGKITVLKLIVLFLHIALSKSHNNINHYEGTPVHPVTTNMAQWAYSETKNQEGMHACIVTTHKNTNRQKSPTDRGIHPAVQTTIPGLQ